MSEQTFASVLRYQGKVVEGKIQSPRCLNKAAGRTLDGQMRFEPVEFPIDDPTILEKAMTFLRNFCKQPGCYCRIWVKSQLRTVGLPEFEAWLARRGAASGSDDFAALMSGEVVGTFRSPAPEPAPEQEYDGIPSDV